MDAIIEQIAVASKLMPPKHAICGHCGSIIRFSSINGYNDYTKQLPNYCVTCGHTRYEYEKLQNAVSLAYIGLLQQSLDPTIFQNTIDTANKILNDNERLNPLIEKWKDHISNEFLKIYNILFPYNIYNN